MATLTSANSVLMLGVQNLFNVPIKIEGFEVDDMFTVQDIDNAEVKMGVDGHLSAGFTPYPVILEVTVQADSTSLLFFETLLEAETLAREKYILNGTILLPAVGRIYAFTRGFMTKASVMSSNKKILQARKFELTFQNATVAPV